MARALLAITAQQWDSALKAAQVAEMQRQVDSAYNRVVDKINTLSGDIVILDDAPDHVVVTLQSLLKEIGFRLVMQSRGGAFRIETL